MFFLLLNTIYGGLFIVKKKVIKNSIKQDLKEIFCKTIYIQCNKKIAKYSIRYSEKSFIFFFYF